MSARQSTNPRSRRLDKLDPMWAAKERDVWERSVMVMLNAGVLDLSRVIGFADAVVEAWKKRFVPGYYDAASSSTRQTT